ncbi:sorting nexin-7 [Papilio machaon]|uniref:sorting nexin-7 n=1 Tax=Papilio machaon TaxID=76193 RepID=UPI001E665843|nr:sorting nexin-7 [Papilio machaon]
MASDSSSAVLDLNDGDITEDTEAPSVTDDAVDGTPLIMEHGYDIAVKVDAPMKQLSTLETFVTYRVRCVCARWPTPPFVRRRYNHFKLLHRRLCAGAPLLAPPALPPLHSARQQLDRYQPAFVHIRALALHAFLDRVAKHPILTHSEDFKLFVITPDEDFDKVFKSENSALNLWGLSSALYGSGESKPGPNGARVQDPEFTSAADYLQSLEQKLTTLCSLTTKLYKGSVALSGEYMSLRSACGAWGAAGAALASGACAAANARACAPLRHRATLPLLAAYARAHTQKIRNRNALHAAYVSGGNTEDLHNKLEQASEALRSELSDWIPKTRAEVKSLLLELADRQVNTHAQTLAGWQQALRLATGADVSEIFKTVSKTAVQNLSPSKCRADTPTEKDFEDLDNYSAEECDIEHSTSDVVGNVDVHVDSSVSVQVNSEEKTEDKVSDPLQDFSEVDLS